MDGFDDDALLRLPLRQFTMAIQNMSPDDQLRAKRARRALQNRDASRKFREHRANIARL